MATDGAGASLDVTMSVRRGSCCGRAACGSGASSRWRLPWRRRYRRRRPMRRSRASRPSTRARISTRSSCCSTSCWCCRSSRWWRGGWCRYGPSGGAASPARGSMSGFVLVFSLLAVIPTIIVAVFSYLLFSFGVQAWFSERVRTALSRIARRRRGLSARAPAGDSRRRDRHGERSQPRRGHSQHQPRAAQPDRRSAGGAALVDRGDRLRRQRPHPRAHRPELCAGASAGARLGAAAGARRRCGDSDQRQRRPRPRARAARAFRRRLSLCRPLRRSHRDRPRAADPARGRAVPAARGRAVGLPDRLLHAVLRGRRAASHRRGVDRLELCPAHGAADQPPHRRGRARARRRSWRRASRWGMPTKSSPRSRAPSTA